MSKKYRFGLIEYLTPTVTPLFLAPIGVAETATRCCYSSFAGSENEVIQDIGKGIISPTITDDLHDAKVSPLVENIVHALQHESVIESVTCSFLIQGISRACYSDDTEVLTRDGWKLFKDTTDDDLFMTKNIETGKEEFQQRTDYIEYHYKGDMHQYKNNVVDLLVTPNHRMVFKRALNDVRRQDSKEELHCVASEDIKYPRIRIPKTFSNYEGNGITEIKIKPYKYTRKYRWSDELVEKTQKFEVKDINSFIQLLAIYISDGSVYNDKSENKHTIHITTPFKDKHELIRNVCSKLGLSKVSDNNTKTRGLTGVRFNNSPLGIYFKRLGKSYQKYIPIDIWELSREQAKLFLNTYLIFDGHERKDGRCGLFTSSKVLSEQLYNICLIAGYSPNCHVVDNVGKEIVIAGKKAKCNHIAYSIEFSKKNKRNIDSLVSNRYKQGIVKDVKYDSNVYCVSVPNGTLFVRRTDTYNASWCGNCLQELARHRVGVSLSVQSTRYTVNDLIKLFFWSDYFSNPVLARDMFVSEAIKLNLFALADQEIIETKLKSIFAQMKILEKRDRVVLMKDTLHKKAIAVTENVHKYINSEEFLTNLLQAPNKRNAGDTVKAILVDEMFSVDLVLTVNLRSLKHFLKLRDSGAAWFPMQVLAKEIKETLPKDYLRYVERIKTTKEEK